MGSEDRMEKDVHNNPMPALRPEATTTKVAANAAGGANTVSAAVGTAGLYRIWASVDVYIQVGTAPVASETYPIAAGIPDIVRLNADDKVAAIAIGAVAGSVFVTRVR